MSITYHIKEISPLDTGVGQLIEKLNAYQTSLYPPEKCHLESPETLIQNKAIMLGAFAEEQLIGMGAVKPMGDYAEIKRMFVDEHYRGTGVAKLILENLEQKALDLGFTIIRLETGSKHFAAMKFYEKQGYSYTEPFGNYPKNDVSVLMQKIIPNGI